MAGFWNSIIIIYRSSYCLKALKHCQIKKISSSDQTLLKRQHINMRMPVRSFDEEISGKGSYNKK